MAAGVVYEELFAEALWIPNQAQSLTGHLHLRGTSCSNVLGFCLKLNSNDTQEDYSSIFSLLPHLKSLEFINKIMPRAQTQLGGDSKYKYHPLPGSVWAQTMTAPGCSTVNNNSDIHSHMRTGSDWQLHSEERDWNFLLSRMAIVRFLTKNRVQISSFFQCSSFNSVPLLLLVNGDKWSNYVNLEFIFYIYRKMCKSVSKQESAS